MKSYDVAIVGGGVIGSSIAFELANEKLRVAVFDRQDPGQEASWAAAGMLSPAPDGPPAIPLVPMANESLALYPAFVNAIEEASGISTDYATAVALELFHSSSGEGRRDKLVDEYRRLGIAVQTMTVEEARLNESSIDSRATAVASYPGEARIDPRRLMEALVLAARRRGVEIHSDAAISSVILEDGRCTGFIAGSTRIGAKTVIIAAGCYSATIATGPGLMSRYAPVFPVRGQMIAMQRPNLRLGHVVRSEQGYLVPRADGRIVAGSTLENAGFDKHVTPAGLKKIIDASLGLVPALADAEIIETWSGLRPGTPDHLPILGPTDIEGLYVATGHYRSGVLQAPATARMFRDWIVAGKSNPEAAIFSPLRFACRKEGLAEADIFRSSTTANSR